MRKALGILLALALVLGSMSFAAANDLEENRPVLKFLVGNRTYDPNVDVPCNLMMELSGYKVEYEMLPSSNGDEKLMLEMAAGTEYDIVELSTTMFGKLADLGVLTPLDQYIETYGEYLVPAVTQMAWDSAKNAKGEIVALPRMNGVNTESTFGARSSRFFMTKQEILDELGLQVPATLDEFTAFLQAIYDAKGVAPLTGSGAPWFKDIMTAFGLPDITWIETDEGVECILEKEGFREYLRYVADLYAKGLLDADLPVNKNENVSQKFTTDGAYVAQYAFWDIPSLIPGLQTSGLSTDLVTFNQPFPDENDTYILNVNYGINKYYGVPLSSKAPAHVVNYFNLISEPETFKITHIGYEGVHHSVDENGNYHPIFPAFNELNWANQFSGLQKMEVEFKQWQARARKTPEMAVAYDAINEQLDEKGVLFINRTSLAGGLPEIQANSQATTVMLNDFMLQCVVENDVSDETFDAFTARFMAEGGQAMKDAYTQWSKENPR